MQVHNLYLMIINVNANVPVKLSHSLSFEKNSSRSSILITIMDTRPVEASCT